MRHQKVRKELSLLCQFKWKELNALPQKIGKCSLINEAKLSWGSFHDGNQKSPYTIYYKQLNNSYSGGVGYKSIGHMSSGNGSLYSVVFPLSYSGPSKQLSNKMLWTMLLRWFNAQIELRWLTMTSLWSCVPNEGATVYCNYGSHQSGKYADMRWMKAENWWATCKTDLPKKFWKPLMYMHIGFQWRFYPPWIKVVINNAGWICHWTPIVKLEERCLEVPNVMEQSQHPYHMIDLFEEWCDVVEFVPQNKVFKKDLCNFLKSHELVYYVILKHM